MQNPIVAATMAFPEGHSDSSYEAVYGHKDLVEQDNRFWLRIEFAGKPFHLPLVDATPHRQDTTTLAWLDANPLRNPSLWEAATEVMEGLLRKSGALAIATHMSPKTGYFITCAVGRVGGGVITMPCAADREAVTRLAQAGSVVEYFGGTATHNPKYMGRPGVIDDSWMRLVVETGVASWADDVRRTGETEKTGRKLLKPVLPAGTIWKSHFLGVESPLDQQYPRPLGPNTYAAIALPVFRGLDRAMLYSIENPGAIPFELQRRRGF